VESREIIIMNILFLSKSKFSIHNGFTLIELIVALSLVVTVSAISMVGFTQFNNNQKLKNAVFDVSLLLSEAKSKAQTQVKPDNIPACLTDHLESYKVKFSATNYELDVTCGGVSVAVQTKQLPLGMTFDLSGTKEFTFPILAGLVNQGSVTIKGVSSQTTINIDKMGNIKSN
jgi:prepilin-type N-terminal cleavage/methylation domain-containing protein